MAVFFVFRWCQNGNPTASIENSQKENLTAQEFRWCQKFPSDTLIVVTGLPPHTSTI
jgi:hypothetical protein